MGDWPKTFHTTLPSDLAEGARGRAWLADCLACLPEASRAVIPDVILAFGEVFTNCVRHAYGPGVSGRIDVSISAMPHEIRLSIQDYGKTMDPACVREPDLSLPHEGGYGLFLIRTLCDEVEFEVPGGVGNRVTLRRTLPVESAQRQQAAASAG